MIANGSYPMVEILDAMLEVRGIDSTPIVRLVTKYDQVLSIAFGENRLNGSEKQLVEQMLMYAMLGIFEVPTADAEESDASYERFISDVMQSVRENLERVSTGLNFSSMEGALRMAVDLAADQYFRFVRFSEAYEKLKGSPQE